MKIQAMLFASVLIFAPSIYSQQKVVILNTGKQDTRIDVSEPTIYLSFERYDGDNSIWLRLHNNSRWTISFRADDDFYGLANDSSTWSVGRDAFGLLNGAKVKPKYAIERLPEQMPMDNLGCVSSESWLPSGRSVIFEIPRKGFETFNKLHITFKYEWETEGFEPVHRVRFDGWELPKVEQ
ncbi:hypothetical protein BH24ACI2_BH24ACI2_09950 [soil metagenome]